MAKGIVAIVFGGPENTHDNLTSEVWPEYLPEVRRNPRETSFFDRGLTYWDMFMDILSLLVDDYEIRGMSQDQVLNHTPDYGFFHVGTFNRPDDLSHMVPAFDVCRNVFLWHDYNAFYLSDTALPFLKEHKEKIRGLMVHNPAVVDVIEKVTGIQTLVAGPSVSRVEELEAFVSSLETKDPIKELLVVGGINERGGVVANTFAEYHFPNSYDVIQRHKHTESVDLLDGCANFYEHMERDAWRKFIADYKYLIDGTDIGCTSGRIGWDALCSGRSFISVKNRSYVSYLFDAISINSEVDFANWEDIGWQEAHKLAKERLVLSEEILAIWKDVL
tara:strand:+ start:371 stop:1366 length:996 start_codon:yes stop_codon:yes gene_type:complete